MQEHRFEVAETDLFAATGTLRERRRQRGAIPLIHRSGPILPSMAQERLWQFSRAAKSSPYFNVPMAWEIRGPVDVHAMDEALSKIVQRHEVLRSNFEEVDGKPVVALHKRPIETKALTILGDSTMLQRELALQRVRAELQKPFDLEHDPLFKAVLIRYGESQSLLLLKVHQLTFDGSSMLLIARELKELYSASLGGFQARLPELPIQYYDFALWQRHLLAAKQLAEEEAYWRSQFQEPYRPMPLGCMATDYRGLPGPSERTAMRISPLVCANLLRLAGQSQTTLFSVLLAGLQACFHVRTDCKDVIVFATVAGRHHPELRNLAGLIANVLPFRVHFTGRESFRQVIQATGKVASDALANQALPLEHILKAIRIAGPAQAGGLFQVMLIHQKTGPLKFTVGDTTFQPLDELENGFCRFGIQLEIHGGTAGLDGWLKHRTGMFDSGFGKQFVAEFSEFLERWASEPDQPLLAKTSIRPETPHSFSPTPKADNQGNRPERVVRSEAARVLASGDSFPRQDFAEAGEKGGTHSTPRDPLEQWLTRTWEQILGVSPVGVQDNFFQLGGDSLFAVQLMLLIEKQTGRNLPLVTLFEAPTIEALAAVLRNKGWQPHWTSLVSIKPDGSKPPFYCVHGVGGNILEFEHLGRYIEKDQPLYGIQAQGLDGKSPRHSSVEEMAAHYLKEIRGFQPTGPYYLGGSSFGGLVAFEIAQQLLADGQEIGLLVMFDTWAPGYPQYLPTVTSWHRRLLQWKSRFDLHWSNICLAQGRQRTEYVLAKVHRLRTRIRKKYRRRLGLLQEGFERAFHPAAIQAVQKAGRAANDTYHPRPFAGKVTLLRASDQPRGIVEERTNGWKAYAKGGVEVHDVPGHHGSIMREPRARVLVENLTACLNRAYQSETDIAETPLDFPGSSMNREAAPKICRQVSASTHPAASQSHT